MVSARFFNVVVASLVHLCCRQATTSTCTFRDFKPLQSAGLPEFQLYLIFGRGWSALFFMKFRWNGQTKSYTADEACGYRILGYISPGHAGHVTKTEVCMYYVSFNKCLVISRLIKALFSSPSKTLQINYIKVWTYTWHIKCSRKKLIFTDCLKISRRIFWA